MKLLKEMILILFLVFSPVVAENLDYKQEVYARQLPQFVATVSYGIHEKCAGLLITLRSVLVFDCDFLQTIDLEMENITMKLNKTVRKVDKIKKYTEISENGKMLPLYVLEATLEFVVYFSPLALNGGDLLETCEVSMIRKFILGFKENETLVKQIKPLPYEVCKQKVLEIKFSNRELCVMDNDGTDGFVFETGSPLICGGYLTGLKLYSMPLNQKQNLTVHVFVRITSLINWFMDENGHDNPTWTIVESDFEEREIIGNNIRMEFRNRGKSQGYQWMLSAQAFLFHYLNKFVKTSLFYY